MNTGTLSPAVIRVGGALEVVFNDVESYADGMVNKPSQVAIARLVEKRLDLNNESSIAMLVDLSAFHGVSQMGRLGKQIDEYGLPAVHLAVAYLYEWGERGRAGDTTAAIVNFNGVKRSYMVGMDAVDGVAELVVQLGQLTGTEVESAEHLSDLIDGLGGLDAALIMGSENIALAITSEFSLNLGRPYDAESDEPVTDN